MTLTLALVAGLGADQLVLEARDQLARAELDRHVLARAAFERLAVDLAVEVDDDEVAGRRPCALLGVVRSSCCDSASCLSCVVDRAFVGLDRQPLELEAVDLRRRHFGQRLEADA